MDKVVQSKVMTMKPEWENQTCEKCGYGIGTDEMYVKRTRKYRYGKGKVRDMVTYHHTRCI
jgi:hypothetical protein